MHMCVMIITAYSQTSRVLMFHCYQYFHTKSEGPSFFPKESLYSQLWFKPHFFNLACANCKCIIIIMEHTVHPCHVSFITTSPFMFLSESLPHTYVKMSTMVAVDYLSLRDGPINRSGLVIEQFHEEICMC